MSSCYYHDGSMALWAYARNLDCAFRSQFEFFAPQGRHVAPTALELAGKLLHAKFHHCVRGSGGGVSPENCKFYEISEDKRLWRDCTIVARTTPSALLMLEKTRDTCTDGQTTDRNITFSGMDAASITIKTARKRIQKINMTLAINAATTRIQQTAIVLSSGRVAKDRATCIHT